MNVDCLEFKQSYHKQIDVLLESVLTRVAGFFAQHGDASLEAEDLLSHQVLVVQAALEALLAYRESGTDHALQNAASIEDLSLVQQYYTATLRSAVNGGSCKGSERLSFVSPLLGRADLQATVKWMKEDALKAEMPLPFFAAPASDGKTPFSLEDAAELIIQEKLCVSRVVKGLLIAAAKKSGTVLQAEVVARAVEATIKEASGIIVENNARFIYDEAKGYLGELQCAKSDEKCLAFKKFANSDEGQLAEAWVKHLSAADSRDGALERCKRAVEAISIEKASENALKDGEIIEVLSCSAKLFSSAMNSMQAHFMSFEQQQEAMKEEVTVELPQVTDEKSAHEDAVETADHQIGVSDSASFLS